MKRIFFPLLLLSLLASSCHRNQLPDGVIDTATMASFLSDALLLEGYERYVISEHPDSLSHQLSEGYNALYTKYSITPASYDSSMAYYVRHPHLYEAIIDRVNERLKAM